jgi:hypothetical protein
MQINLFNRKYSIERCIPRDINIHYVLVKHLITDVSQDEYQNRMQESISQGLAWKGYVDNKLFGFIYNKVEDKIGYGICIYSLFNEPYGFTLLLKEAFTDFPSHKILVTPHKEMPVTYLRSLTTSMSMKRYNWYKEPLAIHIETLYKKFERIYNKFIKDNIE